MHRKCKKELHENLKESCLKKLLRAQVTEEFYLEKKVSKDNIRNFTICRAEAKI
jgi:hypothetical protein